LYCTNILAMYGPMNVKFIPVCSLTKGVKFKHNQEIVPVCLYVSCETIINWIYKNLCTCNPH